MLRTLLLIALLPGLISSCHVSDHQKSMPNVILIVSDDLGYADLSTFGATNIKTPNIDALAHEGLKLTNFTVASSICSPSRAALLTGSYPLRVGVPNVLFPDGAWGNDPNTGLHPDVETIADMLKARGYSTAMAGKWHLGHAPVFLPTEQGFDDFFGIPYSNDMAIVPGMTLAKDIVLNEAWTLDDIINIQDKPWEERYGKTPLMRNNEVIEVPADQRTLTSRLTRYATQFIDQQSGKDPFFLYLAHPMPHIPLNTSDEFRGRSDAGSYGDVIEELDWSTGEIVEALKQNGVLDNTLIIFTSDNGPWLSYGNHGGSAGNLRGGKFDTWEGGFRVPAILHWPSVIERGQVTGQLVSAIDILPTLADITGSALPEQSIDGISVLPLLEGAPIAALESRVFYYFHREQLNAVRQGPWKYVFEHRGQRLTSSGANGVDGEYNFDVTFPEALYQVGVDSTESNNVLAEHRDLASRLRDQGKTFEVLIKSQARSPATFTPEQPSLSGKE